MSPVTLGVTPPLPLDAWFRRPRTTLPWPLAPRLRIHAQARAGLYAALLRSGVEPDAEALLPAYHHGSEIEAYVRAGIKHRFYDLEPGAKPDPNLIDALSSPRTRFVHVTHYLGLPSPVDAWREIADQRGWRLVEDTAQGWLGKMADRPLGATGDIALFSVYKSVGVPDGGIATLHGEPIEPDGRGDLGLGSAARRHARFLGSRIPAVARLWESTGRPYDAARDMALGDPGLAAARITSRLLRRLVDDRVADRRAEAYRRLLADLDTWVPEAWRRDPGESSPFALPVQVSDKSRALAALRAAGIGAVDLWSVPHPSLDPTEQPIATRLRAQVLLLPVHQELRPKDIQRISRVAREILGREQSRSRGMGGDGDR